MTGAGLSLPSQRESRLRDYLALSLFAAVLLLFLHRLVFSPLILPRGDIFLYFYPYWHMRSAVMSAGAIPFWNPDLFMGVPFLANMQAGVLYPPNWLLLGLSAPAAVKVSIVIHLLWAGVGAFLLARRLGVSPLAALLAAITFALGGYVTAQVEHINQLQGLAWLPWLFVCWQSAIAGRHKSIGLLGICFGMMLLAGHSQTVFIGGFGLGAWALAHAFASGEDPLPARLKGIAWHLLVIAIACLLGAALAAPQLLPSAELASLSNRGGGLPFIEAISFSFRPQIAARGLMPSYAGEPLFSEYIASPGVAALMLALVGAWFRRKKPAGIAAITITVLGLFFALGAYNPVYWAFVRVIPGFDLFRAPARWLALWALGAAILAALGLDSLPELLRFPLKRRLIPALAIILLAGMAFLAPLSAADVPGASAPAWYELAIWAVTLALVSVSWSLPRLPDRALLLVSLVAVECFIASRSLPCNDLSDPEAWDTQRTSVSVLLGRELDSLPPGRLLSISDTLFDPGDLAQMQVIYDPYLSEDQFFDLVVATKQWDIIAPNLSLKYGIPSLDGFDGGILPPRDFTRFSALLIGRDPADVAPDGRLRENLDAVPSLDFLSIANVRYILTDKVRDIWVANIYHDRQFTRVLSAADDREIIAIPTIPLEATSLSIISRVEGDPPPGTAVGTAEIRLSEGVVSVPLVIGPEGQLDGVSVEAIGSLTEGDPGAIEYRSLVSWGDPAEVTSIRLELDPDFTGRFILTAVSLYHEETGVFIETCLGGDGAIELIHSGDVKIYEFTGTLPRAYLACDPLIVEDDEAAWDALDGDPVRSVIVAPGAAPAPACDRAGDVTFTRYEAESLAMAVSAGENGAYLIVSDSYYPGWEAAIDGEPAPILRANGVFRAVFVPSGDHEVTMRYHSRGFDTGLIITGIALVTLVPFLSLPSWKAAPIAGLNKKEG